MTVISTFFDCGQIVVQQSGPRTDRHVLAGIVKDDGVNVSRRVCLLDRKSLQLLAVTRSKSDGSFRFSGLPEYGAKSLLVIGFDDEHDGRHNAEALDYVTQIAEVQQEP